jgi:hypothetical protein
VARLLRFGLSVRLSDKPDFAQIDHFNYETHPLTFKQRYMLIDNYYKPGFASRMSFFVRTQDSTEARFSSTPAMKDPSERSSTTPASSLTLHLSSTP